MTAHEATSDHQFGEMKRRLDVQGGFTYDPRKKDFPSSGYSVAAHPAAELPVGHERGGISESHLEGYVAGSAPIWQQARGGNKGKEMIGAWTEQGKDYLDLPKVFPANPEGHTKSRQAQILRNQQASYSLHEEASEYNPYFTGNKDAPPHPHAEKFPEFAGMVKSNRQRALDPEQSPEIAAWSEGPRRQAAHERETKIKGRRAAQSQ